MRQAFITGAGGFIGRAIAERLRADGVTVTGVDLVADPGAGIVAGDIGQPGPWQAAAFSLLMLLATRGKQYSLPELRSMLEGAGFVDVESVQTGGGYYSLVSARKP